MSEDDADDESLAKSLYAEKAHRYYVEGILLTTAIGFGLLASRYGLSVQMLTGDMEGVAMYGGGLIASALMAVRITSDLPGIGLGSALENGLLTGVVSAISLLVLGALFLIPGGIVAIPLAAGLDLLIPGASRTDLNGVLAFAIAAGAAAVFTAAAISTDLSDEEEQQLVSARGQSSRPSPDVNVEIEHEPVTEEPSDSSEATAADAPSSETKHDLEKQLDMVAAYLGKTESRISDSDFEMAETQLSRAEKHLTRAENNESTFPERYHQLRDRAKSLRSLIENSDKITSNLNTAEDCLDDASSYRSHNDFLAAKRQVATAKGRLTRVEGLFEDTELPLPDRYRSLRNRCESVEDSIADAQIGQPLELATDRLEDCESALSDGDLDTARSQLTKAGAHLDEVEEKTSRAPDRYENLRTQHTDLQASIEGMEQITSLLDTAADCLESASSHITTGDADETKTQLSTAKGRLTRAENVAGDSDIDLPARYESLQHRCTTVEESLERAQEIEEPFEMAEMNVDACESYLSDGDVGAARTQLSKAENHLERIEATDVSPPDGYERLRTRYEAVEELIDKPEDIVSQLETVSERLESVSSHLPDGDLGTASEQLSTARDRLSRIEADFEDLIVTPPPRHEELQTRCESLGRSIDSLETARSRFETATKCLESATTHLDDHEFEAAKTQLSTAKGRLTKAETELERSETTFPKRLETLRSRCTSVAETIETERKRVQAENAVSSAIEAMNTGYGAYEEGDLATAASNFETVPEHLETAQGISIRAADFSPERTPDQIAAETARGQVYVEMQRAEQLVADGHEALEDRDFAAAVEAYETGLSKLRLATGIARDHDLPQTWELDERQETITEYLENAEEQRDAADENRLETATHRLDRATRLAETAEQHVEVDDSVAAWEDVQQARDVVDDAFELLTGTAATPSEIEQRASEIEERIETIAAELPEEVRMEGATVTASKRELLTSLQELSVIFGESPRQDFIDAYGVYPAAAYLEVFGSWNAALDEANLAPIDEQARERRVYSRADILDAIVELAEEVGGVPTPEQMNDKGAVSTATVEKRFESWETAVRLTGLETEPTLDAIRELAGSGDASEDEQRDTEAIGTDTSSSSADGSDSVESETESDVTDTADTQEGSSIEDSDSDSAEIDPSRTSEQNGSTEIATGEFADLTDFQRDLLVILAGLEEPKGLRIKEELETYYDDQINHGRLYPNLDTLVEQGFVEKFEIDNRSNGYRLSDKGDRHVRRRWRWEDAHTPSADRIDEQDAEPSETGKTDETTAKTSDSDLNADDNNMEAEDDELEGDYEIDALIEDLLGDIDE